LPNVAQFEFVTEFAAQTQELGEDDELPGNGIEPMARRQVT
jgi:hypothetical protein